MLFGLKLIKRRNDIIILGRYSYECYRIIFPHPITSLFIDFLSENIKKTIADRASARDVS